MENSRAVCLSLFVPPYSDAIIPAMLYTDIDSMLGDEAAQHEYLTFMFTSRNVADIENLERRLVSKGLYVSSNPCSGQYRGVKKLCTLSKQQVIELGIPELNEAFEEGFNVSRPGLLPKEIYNYYSRLWEVKPTLCGLIWDAEDQIGL